MNQTDASKLADKITQTWPSGPRHGAWFDYLADIDQRIGYAVLTALRTTTDRISIASFAHTANDLSGRRNEADEHRCGGCGGDGCITAEPLALHGGTYEQVRPCHCEAGRRFERSPVWQHRNDRNQPDTHPRSDQW